MKKNNYNWIFFIAITVLVSGCGTIGPKVIPRDRFDYNKAVSDSWKEQTLLNIVKLRYADLPLFMEVTSIVSGYTLESGVTVSGTVFDSGNLPATATLGGSGKYTDRPTITYAPITGEKFNKTFMTPIPPSAVLFLLQAGWPAEIVLPITLDSINGYRAQKSVGKNQRKGHSNYYRIVELMTMIQKAGAVGMRVKRGEKNQNVMEDEATVIVIRRKNLSPEILAARKELSELLGINPDADEYAVVYAEVPRNEKELAILTRSTLTIMLELAGQVRVPEHHILSGSTVPSLIDDKDDEQKARRIIDIQSGEDKPDSAFTAVKYRDHWFWIDDRDFRSKRTFGYLMLLFSLTESGAKEGLPLVTIPAG
jgi:uncharacterized protein YceK